MRLIKRNKVCDNHAYDITMSVQSEGRDTDNQSMIGITISGKGCLSVTSMVIARKY